MTNTKKRILLIDDDERLLLTTSTLLEYEGYEVLTHKSAFGATTAIIASKPDLVLLDVNMPGLSGEGLADVIRANKNAAHVKLVFFSSNDEQDLRRAVSEHHADGYICKGDLFSLRERIAALLNSAAAV